MGFGSRFSRALRRVGRVAKKSVGIQARIAAPVKPTKVVKAVKRASKNKIVKRFVIGVPDKRELAIGAAVGSTVAIAGAAGAGAASGAASSTSGIAASAAAINQGVKKITGNTAVELVKQAAIEKRRSRQVIEPSNTDVVLSAPQVPANKASVNKPDGVDVKTAVIAAGAVLSALQLLKG